MSTDVRAIFFGTPDFALPLFQAAHNVVDVVLVVTQPPRIRSKHRAASPTPVQRAAETYHVPILAPERLTPEVIKRINSYHATIGILGAYGKILPSALLELFPKGIVNVHPSLLPLHRGASPIAGSLLAGDAKTGVTLIRLDDKMDHGPIISQEALTIEPYEHRPHLESRLALLGGTMLSEWLPRYLSGNIPLQAQDHARATVTSLLKKQTGTIDWSDDAMLLERKIRAYDPWPGTSTTFDGSPLSVLDARASAHDSSAAQGLVVRSPEGIEVICGSGTLTLLSLKLSGKKAMDADAFVRGHQAFIGSVLG